MITVLMTVKIKAITAIPFLSLLRVKVIKAKPMEAMAVMIRNTMINKPTRSEVAIAMGSRRNIASEVSKLNSKKVKLLHE